MASVHSLDRLAPAGRIISRADWLYLLISLLIQLVLGLYFGHNYDDRIFLATGFLVSHGQDPYISQDLTQVFHNPAFQAMDSVGYPPPWPLALGGIYLLSYAIFHNLLVYNLAIKLPIILANLALAYLVKYILSRLGAPPDKARKAWLFILFTPFLLYFTTAWGQFDSLVALLTLAALVFLSQNRLTSSAIMLSLAFSFKPTPVAIVLVVLVYLWGQPWRRMIVYFATFSLGFFAFCILPFIIFQWSAAPILHGWNSQFSLSGGMTLTTLYELWSGSYILYGNWWLLGFAWLPAILVGAIFLPRGDCGLVGLLKNSLALTLIFYLTRTWLSEQNITLILPMVLILVYLGELPDFTLSATWILPLVFTFFNTSPPQLLFLIRPDLMNSWLAWMDTFRTARLFTRMLVVIPWLVAGWWMVVNIYKSKAAPSA